MQATNGLGVGTINPADLNSGMLYLPKSHRSHRSRPSHTLFALAGRIAHRSQATQIPIFTARSSSCPIANTDLYEQAHCPTPPHQTTLHQIQTLVLEASNVVALQIHTATYRRVMVLEMMVCLF